MHPGLLGLDDVSLDGVEWLVLESDAQAARDAARASEEIGEAWVAGSDGMDAMNLAAAIRADDALMPVYAVAAEVSGSACSRAQAAGLSGVLGLDGLAQRFADERARRARLADALQSLEANLTASLTKRGAAVPAGCAQARRSAGSAAAGAGTGVGAYVLTVLSGSGGAGKSTVAAVAAHVAAAKGHRVLLLDADLQFGDLAYLLAADGAPTVDDALGDPSTLPGLAEQVAEGGVALLAAPKRLEQAEVVAVHIAGLLNTARELFDLVVVNTGASWAECHAALIEQSDSALFLIDQKASSVRACRHAVELCERLGIASGTFSYAINRCKRGALFTAIDVACAMQGAHVHELRDGGADVEELLGAGSAQELLSSKNALCSSVSEMLDELLPGSLAPSGKARGKRRAAQAKGARGEGRSGRRRGRRGAVANASGAAACGAHAGQEVRA